MKSNNKIIVVIFSSLLFFSCEDKKSNYEYTMYRDGYIKFWREPMIEQYLEKMEDGDFLIETPEGDTLMAGRYKKGFKKGKWQYNTADGKHIYIDWEKYFSDDLSLEISYPNGWQLISSDDMPFQATFDTKSKVKNDKYCIILPHQKIELGMQLNEYWEFLNQNMHIDDSVKSHFLRKFSRDDGDFYFSTYTIDRNNEELIIFNFLGETDSVIYDITYSSLRENVDRKHTIFLDMIRSLRIENKRFFSPVGHPTKIIELKFPSDPDVSI